MTQNDPPLGHFPAVELSAPPVAALARTIHAVGDKWAGRGDPALPGGKHLPLNRFPLLGRECG